MLTPYEEEVVVKSKLTKRTILLTVSKDLNLTQGLHPLISPDSYPRICRVWTPGHMGNAGMKK